MSTRSWMRFGACIWLPAIVLVAYSAEPSSPMPPAARGVLVQMEKEVAASKTKAVVALDKVLKDTTKKGDLAGALAVKKAIEQLQAETRGRSGDVTNRIAEGEVSGRWMQGGSVPTEFFANGSVTQGELSGQWTATGGIIEVEWNNQRTYRLRMDADGLSGAVLEATGKETGKVFLTRAK